MRDGQREPTALRINPSQAGPVVNILITITLDVRKECNEVMRLYF